MLTLNEIRNQDRCEGVLYPSALFALKVVFVVLNEQEVNLYKIKDLVQYNKDTHWDANNPADNNSCKSAICDLAVYYSDGLTRFCLALSA